MKSALIIAAILGIVNPAAKVEPWRRVEISGWIRNEEGLDLFGSDEKRLSLEIPVAGFAYTTAERLAFGSQADYKLAEKNIDQAVRMDGYLIRRGRDQWFVPVTMTVKSK